MANINSFIVTGAVVIDVEDLNFSDGKSMYHFKLQHRDISENFDIYVDKEKITDQWQCPQVGEMPRILVQAASIWKDGAKTDACKFRFRFKDL